MSTTQQSLELNHVHIMDGLAGIQCLINQGHYNDILIITDPPFNIGYHYGSYTDRIPQDEYLQRLNTLLDNPTVMINQPETIHQLSVTHGEAPERVVSWVYNTNNRRQHRDIAYYGITPDMKRVRQPYKNPTDKRVRKLIENGSHGSAVYDWWEIQQVKNISKDKTGHPCQMPLEVMMRTLGVLPSEYDDHIIVDPFSGSGTTLIAAQRLGYRFIGFDIDPEYVSISNNRIEKDKGTPMNSGLKQSYIIR